MDFDLGIDHLVHGLGAVAEPHPLDPSRHKPARELDPLGDAGGDCLRQALTKQASGALLGSRPGVGQRPEPGRETPPGKVHSRLPVDWAFRALRHCRSWRSQRRPRRPCAAGARWTSGAPPCDGPLSTCGPAAELTGVCGKLSAAIRDAERSGRLVPVASSAWPVARQWRDTSFASAISSFAARSIAAACNKRTGSGASSSRCTARSTGPGSHFPLAFLGSDGVLAKYAGLPPAGHGALAPCGAHQG